VASPDVKITVGTIAKILLWIVYVWVVLNLVLLFLAFWLQLLGANPQAGFTEWVYRSVSRTMAPFRGIFEPIALSDQSVLNTSLLFAMIIYGVVALLLHAGIDWVTDFVVKRRLRLERETWDDRLETLPASGSNATGLQ
jgi:Na+-translocating ferredoxin:NAD+ oxidoreductase RnfA subunit